MSGRRALFNEHGQEYIIRHYLQGVSIETLCIDLKCSPTPIKKVLKDNNIHIRTRQEVNKKLRGVRNKEAYEEIKELVRAGNNLYKINKILTDVPETTVRRYTKKAIEELKNE